MQVWRRWIHLRFNTVTQRLPLMGGLPAFGSRGSYHSYSRSGGPIYPASFAVRLFIGSLAGRLRRSKAQR